MNKEELKKARKAAYEKAKEARDKSPQYQAFKQKAKERARALYRLQRDRLKAQKNALDESAQLAKSTENPENLEPQLKLLHF